MKKMAALLGILLLASAVLTAHPHFAKTVTMKVGDVEVKLSYFTAPANLEHVENVTVGAFNPSFGTLELSGDLTVGDTTLAAGKYRIGAIKNGDDDWTLALYKGQLGQGQEPDMANVIKLESSYLTNQGDSGHVYFDILPGHGDMDGRVVLIWHFGPLYLAGALS